MIQRIQSLYLVGSIICTGILPFVFYLWKDAKGLEYYFMNSFLFVSLFGLSTTLSIISLISYKKRKQQFALGRLNIISNFFLLGFFVYRSLNLSGEMEVSEKGIGLFLPIISIVCLVLANKAIKKDEELVKSVDRLR